MKLRLLSFFIIFFSIQIAQAQLIGAAWWYVPNLAFDDSQYGAVLAQSLDTVYVVKQGKVFKSTDAAVTWSIYDTGIQENFYSIVFADINTGYAVGDNGTIIQTTDAGVTWNAVALTTTADLFEVAVTPNGAVWVVGENGIIINSTDGVNWVEDNTITSEVLNTVSFKDDMEGVIGGNDATLFKTVDGGVSWQLVPLDASLDFFGFQYSSDGKLFGMFGDAGYPDYNGFVVDRESLYFISTLDLINWDTYSTDTNFNTTSPSGFCFSNNDIYVIHGYSSSLSDYCHFGAKLSYNQGVSWVDVFGIGSDMFSTSAVPEICNFNPGYLRVSTYQDQVGYALVGSYLLKAPYTYNLDVTKFNFADVTIYPNPVTDGQLSVSSSNVDLHTVAAKVYNAQGVLVKSFASLATGTLDVKNLAEGVYFVELSDNNKVVATKKIVIQ